MSTAPCTKCGRPTTERHQDRVSGRIVPQCEVCQKSSSGEMFFMLLALMMAIVFLMQNAG